MDARDRDARRSPLATGLTSALLAALLLPGCAFWGSGSATAGETDDTTGGSAATETESTTAAASTEITVATFNVHLFFDTVCDSGQCSADDFEEVATAAGFEARADELAAAIAALEADVVLLQEIENQSCIDALAARLPEFTAIHLGEQGYPGSIDTAVLSTLPTLAVFTHLDEEFPHPEGGTTSFTRALLEIHHDVGGQRLITFAAHFRSKVFDDPGRRLAEGQRAGEWIALRGVDYPEAMIVLGGDLNDTPGSPPLAALEGAADVTRVAAELEDDTTLIYGGKAQALDHIYVSDAAAGAHVAGSTMIFRADTAMAWTGWGGSDHAAVRATFTFDAP
ncbi:MAG: endonuclease/exonuclease/phosphatase family protein [Myxococcales bacterium]|nr:endonuclease/exonuclease/phosphatase family protein [Myxococcales bacterium]